MKQYNMEQ